MEILIYLGILMLGVISGYILRGALEKGTRHYSGAMVITEEADKRLYSLELYEEVEDLEKRYDIRFKVVLPEKKSNRD